LKSPMDFTLGLARGNLDEDLMIERAIRASVAELQRGQTSGLSDQEAMDRAIRASIAASGPQSGGVDDDDVDHEAALAKAIQESLQQYKLDGTRSINTADGAVPDVESDDDEDMKRAIRQSKEEDEKLKGKETSGGMTEEEIVLEYVKKQSLVEEQHRKEAEEKERKAIEEKKEKEALNSVADEEALRQAIEESLKGGGGPSSAA